jgi:hypothetical protein
MLQRLFLEHPRAMGESYGRHLGRAEGFGIQMVVAGVACMVHGLVPAFFRDTGSNAIRRLHQRMVVERVPETRVPSATGRQDVPAGS